MIINTSAEIAEKYSAIDFSEKAYKYDHTRWVSVESLIEELEKMKNYYLPIDDKVDEASVHVIKMIISKLGDDNGR